MRTRARAFTLIELLVTIAIVAVLIGLLLPGLSSARKTAQGTFAAANLRSMSQVMSTYTGQNSAKYFNPFAARSTAAIGAILTLDQRRWSFESNSYGAFVSEGFAPYWYSFMRAQDPSGDLPRDVIASPADGGVLRMIREESASKPDGLAPSSFYYSACFWKPQADFEIRKFAGQTVGCSDPYGPEFRLQCAYPTLSTFRPGSASVNDVSFPSAKVVFYERADFSQPSRIRLDQVGRARQMTSPAWNHPRARPQVALADSSVTRADMEDLSDRAKSAKDPTRALMPVDLLEAPDAMPYLAGTDRAAIDRQPARDGLYPYFFGVTRNGLRGRDLP